MNELQRSLLVSMRDVLNRFSDGGLELGVLVTTMRGLYESADFQDSELRTGLEGRAYFWTASTNDVQNRGRLRVRPRPKLSTMPF